MRVQRKRGNMMDELQPTPQQGGKPGDGAGRKDEPGHTGIYPLSSSGDADPNAPLISEQALGQGDRGEQGYEDSGDSEITPPPNETTAPDAAQP